MSVERLTKRELLAGHYVAFVSDEDCFDMWSVPKKFMGNAIDRLAAIEDILGDTYDLDHLRDLVEADKDGRCVVLPCKVGTPVYWVVDGGVFECYLNLAAVEEVGKTVFLTREAAEAALAKEAK